jgi:hypothetical protein
MRTITDRERGILLAELAQEFPGDAMMQELHLIRRIHQLETEGMDIAERAAYYREKASNRVRGKVIG